MLNLFVYFLFESFLKIDISLYILSHCQEKQVPVDPTSYNIAGDDLATQVTRASWAMALTLLSQNIPFGIKIP